MKRICLLIMLILLAPCVVHAAVDNLCGPLSLAAICEEYDIDMNLDALCAAVKYDTLFGTNLLNLYHGAKELGLNAKALSMSYRDLTNNGFYIVVLEDNHFEAIQKKFNGVVMLNDKENVRLLSEEEFTSTWNGYAIEFSALEDMEPEPAEDDVIVFQGPKLLLKNEFMEAGTRMEGDFIGFSFPLENIGSDSLRIDNIRATCSCVSYSLTNEVIAPGETEYLYMSVSSTDDVGTFTQYLTARTNDPFYTDITLTVTGNIVTELKAIPSAVTFHDVHANEQHTKEIVVISPNQRTFTIGEVTHPEYMSVKIKEQSTEKSVLEVTLDTKQHPGSYADSLIIQTTDDITDDIHVPVTWTVLKAYEIIPAEIVLLDNNSQDTIKQDFRILTSNEIETVAISCDALDVTWDVKKINDKYILNTFLSGKDNTHETSDTSMLVTINNETINVPIKYLAIE